MKPLGRLLRLRPILLLTGAAAAASALLDLSGLFYLQGLMLVWGAAAMAGIMIYDRRTENAAGAPPSLAEADRLVALRQSLSSMEERLSKSENEDEARFLRPRIASVEHEVRRLQWSLRETEAENLGRATSPEGLRPVPPRQGYMARRGQERQERRHLLDSLDEAEEVLASEPSGSARARLDLIAADIKAHHHLLKQLGGGSRNLGDYGDAWAALASIARGVRLDHDPGALASRKVRAKLVGLQTLAKSRGLVPGDEAGTVATEEERERWK